MTTSFTCISLTISHFLKAIIPTTKNSRVAFRKAVAEHFDINESSVFDFAAGRMGLFSILQCLVNNPDDEVIVAGYTCVVVTNAIAYTNAKAVYADLSTGDLNPSINAIVDKITNNTKAIIIPHNFGLISSGIKKLMFNYPNVIIIEDSAHTISSCDTDNNRVGTIGHAAMFSMEYSKPITTGLGGWIIVNDSVLKAKIQKHWEGLPISSSLATIKGQLTLFAHLVTSYRFTVWLKSYIFIILKRTKLLLITEEAELKGIKPNNYPTKLSSFQLRLAIQQLINYRQQVALIKKQAFEYHCMFDGNKFITDFYSPNVVYNRYPIHIPQPRDSGTSASLITAIRNIGVDVGEWFNDVVHPKGSFSYQYQLGSCYNGEHMSRNIINLPVGTHNKLSEKQKHMLKKIISVYELKFKELVECN
jgi:dTDP-4-amino-4,6-dideoxygalactose transaminase